MVLHLSVIMVLSDGSARVFCLFICYGCAAEVFRQTYARDIVLGGVVAVSFEELGATKEAQVVGHIYVRQRGMILFSRYLHCRPVDWPDPPPPPAIVLCPLCCGSRRRW